MKQILFAFLIALVSCQNTEPVKPAVKIPVTDEDRFLARMKTCLPGQPLVGKEKWEPVMKDFMENLEKGKISEKRYTDTVSGRKLMLTEYTFENELIAVKGVGDAGVNPLEGIPEDMIQSVVYGHDEMSSKGTAEREHIRNFYEIVTTKSTENFNRTEFRRIIEKDSDEFVEHFGFRTGGGWAVSPWRGYIVYLFDGRILKMQGPKGTGRYKLKTDTYLDFNNTELTGLWETWEKK